jgi:hypothetical protein
MFAPTLRSLLKCANIPQQAAVPFAASTAGPSVCDKVNAGAWPILCLLPSLSIPYWNLLLLATKSRLVPLRRLDSPGRKLS